MTLDEAVASAIALIGKNDFEEAWALLAGIDLATPGNPTIIGLMGQTCLKMGRYGDGVALLRKALSIKPHAEYVFDIFQGLVQMAACEDVVTLCHDFAHLIEGDTRFLPFLGFSQFSIGQVQDSLITLTRAREAFPENFSVWHNLSTVLVFLGRGEEAVECYSGLLRDWDGGREPPASAERLDSIAAGYDLKEVHNWFSLRLLRLYVESFPGRPLRRVLELGTGTGLLASRLPASASSVTGVEYSTAMLAQARQRKIYNHLIEGRLPGVLETVEGPFETILSSCVLCYFADLQPFFTQAARLLVTGGVFLFSVDPLSDPREVAVTGPGEYAHSRAYLRRLAAGTGFKEVAIEIDRHRGPPGFWCAFKRG